MERVWDRIGKRLIPSSAGGESLSGTGARCPCRGSKVRGGGGTSDPQNSSRVSPTYIFHFKVYKLVISCYDNLSIARKLRIGNSTINPVSAVEACHSSVGPAVGI